MIKNWDGFVKQIFDFQMRSFHIAFEIVWFFEETIFEELYSFRHTFINIFVNFSSSALKKVFVQQLWCFKAKLKTTQMLSKKLFWLN